MTVAKTMCGKTIRAGRDPMSGELVAFADGSCGDCTFHGVGEFRGSRWLGYLLHRQSWLSSYGRCGVSRLEVGVIGSPGGSSIWLGCGLSWSRRRVR